MSPSSSPPPSPTTASQYTAPTPTYTPLSDCPDSNNTLYSSSFAPTNTGQTSFSSSLNFTKFCDVASPLSETGASTLAEAFVYSFTDCIEICASLNHRTESADCSVAAYQANGKRPSNCFVGSVANGTAASSLEEKDGSAVALLDAR